jgi:hypothetical protein
VRLAMSCQFQLLMSYCAGVPSFFARLPVLGGLLRQVSLGTIKRLVEDLLYIVKKVRTCLHSFGTASLIQWGCVARCY